MKNKINYRLGDIFKIPISEGIFGLGRILIEQSPAIFVGFYNKILINDKVKINIDVLKNEKYFIQMICGDLGFKRKEWYIIGNIPIEEKIKLPFFWGRDLLTNKFYLRKYNSTDKDPLGLQEGFIDRITTEKEIKDKKAQPDGLCGWKAAEAKLKHYLEKAGIL